MNIFARQSFLRRLWRKVAARVFTRRTKQFFLRAIVWCLLAAGAFAFGWRPIAGLHDIRLYAVLSVIAIALWLLAEPVLFVLSRLLAKTTAAAAAKQLFLRMLFAYTLIVTGFVFYGGALGRLSSIAALFVVALILAIATTFSIMVLKLAWKTEVVMEKETTQEKTMEEAFDRLQVIYHEADHIQKMVHNCQTVAIIAIMSGIVAALYLMASSMLSLAHSASSAADVLASMRPLLLAVADGMVGTIIGVISSLVLGNADHFLRHKIERWCIERKLDL